MVDLHLPEKAIEAYEKSTGFTVTLHYRDPRLWSILSPTRWWHGSVACRAVKQFDDNACMAFDVKRVQARLAGQPEGFVKVCHAGLVEWVVGVRSPGWAAGVQWSGGGGRGEQAKKNAGGAAGAGQGVPGRDVPRGDMPGGDVPGGDVPEQGRARVGLILFGGQALPGDDFSRVGPLVAEAAGRGALPMRARLQRVGARDAMHHLELLSQLGARLELWLEAMFSQGVAMDLPGRMASRSGGGGQGSDTTRSRRQRIELFIRQRHTQQVTIDDLAQALGISASRAAHVVSQEAGKSFGQLLTEARLRTAASMLSHTMLSVLDVAIHSGFGDVSNFHRRFRERLGVSPLQYRKQVEVTTPLTISV